MMRVRLPLLAVILVELIVGSVLVYRKRSEPVPPVPELSFVDPLAAADIRGRVADCRTPGDWAALGELYMAYGCYPEAEACCRVAAHAEPALSDRDRVYGWAFALERIGDLEKSSYRYSLAAVMTESSSLIHESNYLDARNWLRQGRPDIALSIFQSNAAYPSARYELARLHDRSGERVEAIAILDRLIAEYPDAVQPVLLRHRIEVETGGPRAAEFADRSGRASKRLPTPFDRDWKRLDDAYRSTGTAAEMKECESLIADGKVAEAEKRLQALLQVAWEPAVADLLAEVAFLRHRPAEAARILQEIVDRAGASPHFLDRLGDAWSEAGKPDAAVTVWQRGVNLGIGAEIKNIHHKLALHFEGDRERARRHHALAYLAAGHEAFWNADYETSLDALSQALEQDSSLAAAWFYRGEARRLLGQAESARADYRRCLELDAGFGRATGGLALLPASR